MKKTKNTLALCAISMVLASCGGGGGGSSSTGPNSEPDTDVQSSDEDEAGADSTPVDDAESESSASREICASNTSSSAATIGNNSFVFEADAGQCFGRRTAVGLEKRLVPIVVTQEVKNDVDRDLLSVEPLARMITNPYDSPIIGEGTWDTFAVDVTNQHTLPICVESSDLRILNDVGDVVATYESPDMAGDQYQLSDADSNRNLGAYENTCIAPGETRSLYGAWLEPADLFVGEQLPDYSSIELPLELQILAEGALMAEPLTPGEFLWTVDARSDNAPNFNPYTVAVTVQNLTSQSVLVTPTFGRMIYLDDEGYVLRVESLRVEDFLDVSLSDLSDDDRSIAPGGGTIGFLRADLVGVGSGGADASSGFDGPASRALFHMRRCVGEDC